MDELLKTPMFRAQVAEWRRQRERLRSNFRQLWGSSGGSFRSWWASATPEVRLAVLLASKEDVERGSGDSGLGPLGVLVDSLLPELAPLVVDCYPQPTEETTPPPPAAPSSAAPPEAPPAQPRQISQPHVGMCELMQAVNDKRDVETSVFTVTELKESGVSPDGLEPLLVARSCLLLQFCSCSLLLSMSQQEPEQSPEPRASNPV